MNQLNIMAQTWDDNNDRLKYSEAISAYVRSHSDKDQRLQALEVGAGLGTLSVLLADDFSRIDLIDGSVDMVDQMTRKLAENHLYHLSPIKGNLLNYNPIKLYDVVYSAMFLHHARVVGDVLKKIYDMTQTGGKLFLCDLYQEDGRFHPNTSEGVYHHGFDPDKIANHLKSLGFTINNIQTVYNYEKHDRLYPMFLIEASKK